MIPRILRFAVLAAATASGAALASASPVSAQSWWGGSSGANSVSDRHVVAFPKTYSGGQIIVSFGDRRLYHVVSRGTAVSYPIAVPRPQSRWQGVERVTSKRVNPPWTPTTEMRQENPSLPVTMPGGHPRNPLGVRAIYLGNTLYRIHGTDAPWTIGKNVSKGCVRMHNAHVVELYEKVHVGMKVTATWQKFNADAPVTASATSGGANFAKTVFDPLSFQ